MTRLPPRGEGQVQQVQDADNASGAHPKTEKQTQANRSLDRAHDVAEEDGVRQDQTGEYRSVKTHRAIGDVALEIGLEAAVGKARTGEFVFAKQQKEDGGGNAHTSDCPGQGGMGGEHGIWESAISPLYRILKKSA
ncbi:MAG: hypothetical protein WB562_12410 [Candidatus Sulfotelmatobacter sp.]